MNDESVRLIKLELGLLLMLLFISSACNPPVSIDHIQALRKEAPLRGLKWRIFCTGRPTERRLGVVVSGKFIAQAVPKTSNFAAYIEDGAQPGWFGFGETQEEAAEELLKAMHESQNMIPDHRPDTAMLNCPPDVSGE